MCSLSLTARTACFASLAFVSINAVVRIINVAFRRIDVAVRIFNVAFRRIDVAVRIFCVVNLSPNPFPNLNQRLTDMLCSCKPLELAEVCN